MDVTRFYKDEAGEWRYTRTAANGEKVDASTEGYKNLSDCMNNYQRKMTVSEIQIYEE